MPSHNNNYFFVGPENFTINKFASLDSTNLYLKNHIAQYPDFTLIHALSQSCGRGRFDRKWLSSPGKSLTFSVKIPLDMIPQSNWSNITQVMALSIAELLEELGLQPQIRWPNDILVNGSKICGILAESVSQNSSSWLVLGVGINVNNQTEEFQNIDRAATSLSIETGKEFEIDAVLQKLLYHFSKFFERFVKTGFGDLVGTISAKLYKPKETVWVIQGNDTYEGKMQGITDKGTILLETIDGIKEIISGEITSRKI